MSNSYLGKFGLGIAFLALGIASILSPSIEGVFGAVLLLGGLYFLASGIVSLKINLEASKKKKKNRHHSK